MNDLSFSATRFSDRVSRLLERVTYRCATTPAERDAIFRLRYDAYMREGGIEPNAASAFADPDDDAPNVWIIGMYIDGELASSIRLHVASNPFAACPSAHVFHDEITPYLDRGCTFVDPTRHVTKLAFSKRFPELPYLTVRSAWMAGEYFDANYILAAVRVEHQLFYKKVFGHVVWSDPKSYPLLKKPIVCLAMDYQQQKHSVEAKYPFYVSSRRERDALFDELSIADASGLAVAHV